MTKKQTKGHESHKKHQEDPNDEYEHKHKGFEEFEGEVHKAKKNKTKGEKKEKHKEEEKDRYKSRRGKNKNKVKGKYQKQVKGNEEDDVITTEKRKLIAEFEKENSEITHRELLKKLAIIAMKERDLKVDFEENEINEENENKKTFEEHKAEEYWKTRNYKDLRALDWLSIDNDDSRDLDQLSVAISEEGKTRLLVAIADVDDLIKKGSLLDQHAEFNTCSIYTPAIVFTMLPHSFCFDMTSLNPDVDRFACVVDMAFDGKGDDGRIVSSEVYFAIVKNKAKLAYPSVGKWLAGQSPPPPVIADRPEILSNLLLQNKIAEALKARRKEKGALHFDRNEGFVEWDGDRVVTILPHVRNPATELIENLMIAANGEVSKFLEKNGFPTIQRIVKEPERWEKLVDLAKKYHFVLPPSPNSKQLRAFLLARSTADPVTFPDLSLQVIKLMGRGEYAFTKLNEEHDGHFGLAVKDYTHTTAPNRRYPDLITQRLLRAALNSEPSPYTEDELSNLADQCTTQEANASKVERQINKSVGAILLQSRIGDEFEGIVTGVVQNGVYARIFELPIEGKVVKNSSNLHLGDRVTLQLHSIDLLRSHIDFKNITPGKKSKKNVKTESDDDNNDDDL